MAGVVVIVVWIGFPLYFRGNLLAVLLLVVERVLECPSAHQHTRVIYALRRADIGLWLSAAPAMDQVRSFLTPMTRILGEFEPILTERLARFLKQIWNNNVDVVNSNFEWNRIGIAIDAGDNVNIAGNDIEGHGGA